MVLPKKFLVINIKTLNILVRNTNDKLMPKVKKFRFKLCKIET